jgi:hypothetical protein
VKKELAEHDFNTLDKVHLLVLARGWARSKNGGDVDGVFWYTKHVHYTLVHITSSSLCVHLEVLCLCRKKWTWRMNSQQVQRSNKGVLFVFMSLMKSLTMVARTEVLQRNTPKDWSVKDRTSCKEKLHLGREDDIIKIVQVEGAKCISTWGPTGAKGQPNRARMGLGQSAQAIRTGLLQGSVRPPFSCTRRTFNPKFVEVPPFARQRAIHIERPSTS